MCYYVTFVMWVEQKMSKKNGELEEKQSRSFCPVSSGPPAVVEVDQFPTDSITRDKDSGRTQTIYWIFL